MADPFTPVALSGDIDAVAHIIQVALTPVFLLSGIGTLLNLFNTRLARVSDHTEHLTELLETEQDEARLAMLLIHRLRLKHRRAALDAAMVLSALGAASTCGAVFALFLGSLRDSGIGLWLVGLFGGALLCTVASLIAFLTDAIMAWHGLRSEGPMPMAKKPSA